MIIIARPFYLRFGQSETGWYWRQGARFQDRSLSHGTLAPSPQMSTKADIDITHMIKWTGRTLEKLTKTQNDNYCQNRPLCFGENRNWVVLKLQERSLSHMTLAPSPQMST